MSNARDIYRVTVLGGVINLLLVAIKFTTGILGSSAAMVADAVHSLSDLLSDIIVIIFVRISRKSADESHNYGHGKYETLATIALGGLLLIVSGGILHNSIDQLIDFSNGILPEMPGKIALWAALASILLKEFTYRITIIVGKRENSDIVVANAWHHRTDSLSSIGTALGIGGALALGSNWAILDAIAALVVSIFIAIAAVEILLPALGQLVDRALPQEEIKIIRAIAAEDTALTDLHNLRTRRVGNIASIEMHLRMPGDMPLSEAHRHATLLEHRIKEKFGKDTLINIHIEPIK